jgi:hypothetical protein
VKAKFLIAGALVAIALAGGAAFLLMQTQKPPVSTSAPAATAPAPQAPAQATPTPAPAPVPVADCLLPGPPPVPPDGATASQDDMKLGHDVIQAYVVQLEAYQACRNAQADHAPLGTSDERKRIWIEQGNAAVDQAHAIADAFSAQLRAFKQRHPEQSTGAK